jgi:hypothetical protein
MAKGIVLSYSSTGFYANCRASSILIATFSETGATFAGIPAVAAQVRQNSYRPETFSRRCSVRMIIEGGISALF